MWEVSEHREEAQGPMTKPLANTEARRGDPAKETGDSSHEVGGSLRECGDAEA